MVNGQQTIVNLRVIESWILLFEQVDKIEYTLFATIRRLYRCINQAITKADVEFQLLVHAYLWMVQIVIAVWI